MNHYDNEDYLTGDEQARFAALPREVPVGPHQEDKTITELRNQRLLESTAARHSREVGDSLRHSREGGNPLRHSRARLPRQTVSRGGNPVSYTIIGLAAATAIFFAGFTFGKQVEQKSAQDPSPIAEVQRAGSAYVAALVRLAESGSTDAANTVANGLEVGTSTLRAAAVSAARIAPEDPALTRIRDGLELATNFTSGTRKLVWY